jgi:uncharacterized protein YdaU (DUF1376 family)
LSCRQEAQAVKGGKTPIHRQPWYPSDYHEDEHVKLLKARRDYLTLTFYRHFLDKAWTAGGDLPADPEALAAVVEMPRKDVEKALAFCLGRLIAQDGDRLFQKRVKRDLQKEDTFSADQARRGALGAKARWDGERHTERDSARHRGHDGPPLPVPVPTPVPVRLTPAPSPPEPDRRPPGPANPLVAGRRPELEGECLRLVREVAEITGDDPVEVIAQASGYEGAATTKLNPASMSDDRLANTVRDLRADLAELRKRKGAHDQTAQR